MDAGSQTTDEIPTTACVEANKPMMREVALKAVSPLCDIIEGERGRARELEAELEALKRDQQKASAWARQLKINQEKSKFKTPADKRAIEYL